MHWLLHIKFRFGRKENDQGLGLTVRENGRWGPLRGCSEKIVKTPLRFVPQELPSARLHELGIGAGNTLQGGSAAFRKLSPARSANG